VIVARAALLAALFALSGCQCASDGPAERVALLVGVDTQADPGITPLPGAAHDVALMKALLIERFGFSRWDIQTLTGEDATAEGIRQAFRRQLIERAGPGTVAVFHFSGHGRLVHDASGDEPDGSDEAIVPYDARTGFEGAATGDGVGILDDEIGTWLDALVATGASPTLIFDSCYSGSPARGDGVVVRSAPPVGLTRGRVAGGRGGPDRLDGAFVVVSAAQSYQEAGEAIDEAGHPVGLFTWALVKTLSRLEGPTTWRTIGPVLAREVGLRKSSQTPRIDGRHRDRMIFGLDADPPPPGALAVGVDDAQLIMAGGSLHGVTAASTWTLLRPGGSAAAAPVADVIELGPLSARLGPPRNPQSGATRVVESLPPGTLAVERSRVLRADAPRIAVPTDRPQISAALERMGIEAVEAFAPLRLVIDAEQARFEWLDGRPLGFAQPAEPAALSQTAWRLTHWLRLARLEGGHPAKVRMHLRGARPSADGMLRVRPGDTVQLAVDNQEPYRAWFATLLDLSDDGTITQLWPEPGADSRLSAERGFTAPAEGALTITIPPGRARTVDVLKLILTAEKVDFSPLVRGAADAGGHALVRWLSATRGSSAGTLRQSDWAVQTLWVETCETENCQP